MALPAVVPAATVILLALRQSKVAVEPAESLSPTVAVVRVPQQVEQVEVILVMAAAMAEQAVAMFMARVLLAVKVVAAAALEVMPEQVAQAVMDITHHQLAQAGLALAVVVAGQAEVLEYMAMAMAQGPARAVVV